MDIKPKKKLDISIKRYPHKYSPQCPKILKKYIVFYTFAEYLFQFMVVRLCTLCVGFLRIHNLPKVVYAFFCWFKCFVHMTLVILILNCRPFNQKLIKLLCFCFSQWMPLPGRFKAHSNNILRKMLNCVRSPFKFVGLMALWV